MNNNPRFHDLRRLKQLRVYVGHRKGATDEYVIDSSPKKDSSYPLHFNDGTTQTVAEYSKITRDIRLQYTA